MFVPQFYFFKWKILIFSVFHSCSSCKHAVFLLVDIRGEIYRSWFMWVSRDPQECSVFTYLLLSDKKQKCIIFLPNRTKIWVPCLLYVVSGCSVQWKHLKFQNQAERKQCHHRMASTIWPLWASTSLNYGFFRFANNFSLPGAGM